MKYGQFDDLAREYVINTPQTPFPWINYLGTENFFGIISNTAGGYCFYKDARLRRLTRYRYNNVPTDTGGRYFYINDVGDVWNPGWKPVKAELDEYSCRHGLGYSIIKGVKNKLEAEVRYFVPIGQTAEVHQIKLTNLSSKIKKIKLFSFVEFCLWNALDDQSNYQRNLNTGEMEVEGSVIYHKTEYRERRNHYAFFSVNAPIDGFDGDRETFLGQDNGFDHPQSVFTGQSGNTKADGWSPIASHCLNIALEPGESKDFIFVLGYAENNKADKWESAGIINKKPAKAIINSLATSEQAEKAFSELRAYWDGLLANYSIQSENQVFDRVVSIWNQYQCVVTYHMSRSASLFESGIGRGLGFRDSNQDLLGYVHQLPQQARQRIVDLAATQFADGSAYHQYQPLTKKGNADIGGNFNDDPLWLILGVSAYIKETGDWSILNEQVPFAESSQTDVSIMEHLHRSFNHVINNLGPHGLPLIGRADWNDCLNLNCYSDNPDDSFQTCENKDGKTAESVLIAGMFVFIGREYMTLCRKLGLNDAANMAEEHIKAMEKTVLKHGYFEDWFLRAYDDKGKPIGKKGSGDGNIYIESQGFCSMAEIGLSEGKVQRALDSVKEYLDTEYGIVLLNPPYADYHLSLGEVSSYPPGYKENAGIFCHNNPWIIIAETILGRSERAFDYFQKITPAFREDKAEKHRMEPYVYAQMIAGKDAGRHGEAKNSWLTGTAAWCFFTASQYILGVRPQFEGLLIDPCIPSNWKGFKIKRQFRGAIYDISVENPNNVAKGVVNITVDGKPIRGNILPVFSDGAIHKIQVEMG